MLIYLCTDLTEAGYRIQLELGHGQACGYLVRAGLLGVLPPSIIISSRGTVSHQEIVEQYWGNSPTLLEITPINSTTDTGAIATRALDVLVAGAGCRKGPAGSVASAVSELCANVVEHNGEDIVGLVAMQSFHGRYGPYIHVIVGDHGQGIRRTLARNPAYRHLRTDLDAIQKSIKVGVTRHQDDDTHGLGLPGVMDLMGRYGGGIYVRSGQGRIYRRPGTSARAAHVVPSIGGTQIFLDIPAERLL